MFATLKAKRELSDRLATLLEATPEAERPMLMEQMVEAFVAGGRLADVAAGAIRRESPMEFALDLIETNEDLYPYLSLNPKAAERAMQARDPMQLVTTLA